MRLKEFFASLLLAVVWGLWIGYLIWGYK